jgi:hypothetical protein
VSEDLGFELRGVPADMFCSLSLDPKVVAPEHLPFLQVAPGQKREVAFQFRLGSAVRGRVVDDAGSAVAAARVSARPSEPKYGFLQQDERETETDEAGAFELRGLQPGALALRAESDVHVAATLALEELEDGDVRDALVLTLGTGAALAGRVTWPDGSPAAGASVAISVPGVEGPFGTTGPGRRTATTDGDGRFRFTGLAEGAGMAVHATAPPSPARSPSLRRSRSAGASSTTRARP